MFSDGIWERHGVQKQSCGLNVRLKAGAVRSGFRENGRDAALLTLIAPLCCDPAGLLVVMQLSSQTLPLSLLSVSLLLCPLSLSLCPPLTFCSPLLSSSLPAADMAEYRSRNHGAVWTVPAENNFSFSSEEQRRKLTKARSEVLSLSFLFQYLSDRLDCASQIKSSYCRSSPLCSTLKAMYMSQ